jgi:hypothetical protein
MKRDALDAVFSDVIRESYDWICVNCGLEFPERKGRNAQCSHFYKRKYNSTRWFPDNCVLLCGTCHAKYEDAPYDHTQFMAKVLGETRLEMLARRWRGIFRYKPADKKAMRLHYAGELERIRAMRFEGVTGPVEVVAYD